MGKGRLCQVGTHPGCSVTVLPISVDVTFEGGVAHVLLNRPEVRNALDLPTIRDLRQALDEVTAKRARALVLAGAGRAFCSGADLAALRQAFDGDTSAVLGPMVE